MIMMLIKSTYTRGTENNCYFPSVSTATGVITNDSKHNTQFNYGRYFMCVCVCVFAWKIS